MIPELWAYIDNFSKLDFNSKDVDSGGEKMSPRLVMMLQALRLLIGKPFIINSGFRTPEHNKAVGGAPGSAHLTGEAVDVRTRGWTKEQRRDFIIYARKLGFNGVGIGATYIHIDIKPRVASWIYSSAGIRAVPVGNEAKFV